MASKRGRGSRENAARLRHRALELRIAGRTYREIARELGRSVTAVHKYVQSELADLAEENRGKAAELRVIEHQRLERQYAAAWADYEAASHPADRARFLGVCLRVSESIRKLYGLDAPERLAVQEDRPSEMQRLKVALDDPEVARHLDAISERLSNPELPDAH